jgi:N-acetylglucosamine-6-phosphate deacetylase
MDRALAGAVAMLGISVEEAVELASASPARVLGLQDRKGAIAPGLDADLAVLDDDLACWATMVRGRWVHGPPSEAG